MLHQVSGDRLRHEFDLAFREINPSRILARMAELDLLIPIHHGLKWSATLTDPLSSIRSTKPEQVWELPTHVGNIPLELALYWLVWLGHLPVSSSNEISQRFKFPAPLASALKATADILPQLNTLPGLKPSEVSKILDPIPSISLYAASLLNLDVSVKKSIMLYQCNWKKIQLKTTGDDLRNAGILPGPDYKRILKTLRSAYLDGTISTPDEESQLLHYLLQQD